MTSVTFMKIGVRGLVELVKNNAMGPMKVVKIVTTDSFRSPSEKHANASTGRMKRRIRAKGNTFDVLELVGGELGAEELNEVDVVQEIVEIAVDSRTYGHYERRALREQRRRRRFGGSWRHARLDFVCKGKKVQHEVLGCGCQKTGVRSLMKEMSLYCGFDWALLQCSERASAAGHCCFRSGCMARPTSL